MRSASTSLAKTTSQGGIKVRSQPHYWIDRMNKPLVPSLTIIVPDGK